MGRGATRSVRLAGTVTAAVVLLTACTAQPPPPPEPELLTLTAASTRYLDAVCPVNAAWDAVDLEVDRLRITESQHGDEESTRPDTRPFDMGPLIDAIRRVEESSLQAADLLGDEAVAWPRAAAGPVADVRASLEADAEQALAVAELAESTRDAAKGDGAQHGAAERDVAALLHYSWDGAEQLAAAAEQARAALDLPANPEVACESWGGEPIHTEQ